jgi:D-threo-aldose 1-dehydrogenase
MKRGSGDRETVPPDRPASLGTRRLGRTAVEVTVGGLGGAPLGNLLRRVAEGAALGAVETAYDLGVRYFDVAPQYGHGLAEHRFGQALRHRPRESYVLSTKVGRLCRPSRRGRAASAMFVEPLPFDLVDDYSYDAVMRSVEDSLQRLGLDRVDLLFIHNVDPANHAPPELDRLFAEAMDGAYRALDRLRGEGVVRGIGVGNNFAEMCERFAAAGDFDCFLVAGRYTLLEQGALDRLLPLCQAREIGLIVGGPFNSGILATGAIDGALYDYRPAPPPVLERVSRIEAVCTRHGVPLPAAALQFPLGHPAVASVIPGGRTSAEVRLNLECLRHPVPAALWADLKADGLLRPDAPIPAPPEAARSAAGGEAGRRLR